MSTDPELELKLTDLSTLYNAKVTEWLSKNNNTAYKFHLYEAARGFFNRRRQITEEILAGLEKFCKQAFHKRKIVASIDLTCTDCNEEDSDSGNGTNSPTSRENSPVPSTSAQTAQETSQITMNPNRFVIPEPARASVLNLSVEFESPLNHEAHELPAPLPSTSSLLPSEAPPEPVATSSVPASQRRKSVNSRPASSKDLPSIAECKTKTTVLKNPAAYAKPSEENVTRNIITVPYKNPPAPKNDNYDPKAAAQKLEGIKVKIYADKFLQFDVAKKAEMQKEFAERQQKEAEAAKKDEAAAKQDEEAAEKDEETDDQDEAAPTRTKRPRGKSVTKEPERKKRSVETKPARKPKSATKKKVKPLEEYDDTDDYDNNEIPGHVYDDDIESQLALFEAPAPEVTQLTSNLGLQTRNDPNPSNNELEAPENVEPPNTNDDASNHRDESAETVVEENLELEDEDDLLVEVEMRPRRGRPRRATMLVPKYPKKHPPRRNAIDEAPVEVKQEPTDEI